jgi:hypothetical protein
MGRGLATTTVMLAAVVYTVAGLSPQSSGSASGAGATSTGPDAAPSAHLQTRAASFVLEGRPFEWRGISAFRLVEMEAHGRHADVGRYLDWAAAHHLTVVRVFAMARHLFELSPEDGLRALPRVLEQAQGRRIHVQIVALADTLAIPVDLDAHVQRVGAIAGRYPNAIIEIANEPAHPTQRAEVHDPRVLQRLRALIPAGVPVALGSAEEDPAYANGTFATMHFPRAGGQSGWRHVLALAEGPNLIRKWGKPLINDEPIGAAEHAVTGRRDNLPARFRAAALLTRLGGMGGTFHYEGGLQARIPSGRELACFRAWNSAWELLERGVEHQGVFQVAGQPGAAVMAYAREHAGGVFERRAEPDAWILAVDVTGDPALKWGVGWKPVVVRRLEGAWLITARRPLE